MQMANDANQLKYKNSSKTERVQINPNQMSQQYRMKTKQRTQEGHEEHMSFSEGVK